MRNGLPCTYWLSTATAQWKLIVEHMERAITPATTKRHGVVFITATNGIVSIAPESSVTISIGLQSCCTGSTGKLELHDLYFHRDQVMLNATTELPSASFHQPLILSTQSGVIASHVDSQHVWIVTAVLATFLALYDQCAYNALQPSDGLSCTDDFR